MSEKKWPPLPTGEEMNEGCRGVWTMEKEVNEEYFRVRGLSRDAAEWGGLSSEMGSFYLWLFVSSCTVTGSPEVHCWGPLLRAPAGQHSPQVHGTWASLGLSCGAVRRRRAAVWGDAVQSGGQSHVTIDVSLCKESWLSYVKDALVRLCTQFILLNYWTLYISALFKCVI